MTDRYVECIYCNADVPSEGEYVPAVDDDADWIRLAGLHAADCEWIETRAHRIDGTDWRA